MHEVQVLVDKALKHFCNICLQPNTMEVNGFEYVQLLNICILKNGTGNVSFQKNLLSNSEIMLSTVFIRTISSNICFWTFGEGRFYVEIERAKGAATYKS